MPGFSSLTSITGADTATGDLFLAQDVSAGTSIKERKITRAELALALVAEGLVKTDGDGNIVGPIIPRALTASAMNAVTLDADEIAVTTDTDEVRKGDGATAGGLHVSGVISVNHTPVADTTYAIPRGKHVIVFVNDYNVSPAFPMFKLNPAMQAGDRVQIIIYGSTGQDLTGTVLFYLGDPLASTGQSDYSGIVKTKGTPDSITDVDPIFAISCVADAKTMLDMTLTNAQLSGNPVLVIDYLINLEATVV